METALGGKGYSAFGDTFAELASLTHRCDNGDVHARGHRAAPLLAHRGNDRILRGKAMFRRITIALLALLGWNLAAPWPAGAQWQALGLSGRQVNRLHLRSGHLYACTTDGLHRLSLAESDSFWTSIGFAGQSVLDLVDLSSSGLLAAKALTGAPGDTVSLFRSMDGGTSWEPFQNGFGAGTGISGHQARRLLAMAGTPGVLLATSGRIEKSVDDGLSWYPVVQAAVLNAIAQSPANPDIVWAGGETLIFAPYVLKSINAGETWSQFDLFAGGDNAVDAIACHPTDSNSVYLGMEGRVMKTEDGGESWSTVTSPDPSMYTFGMAIRPALPLEIYAAGASYTPDPRGVVLHQSLNGGLSWRAISYPAYAGYGVYDLLLRAGAVEEIYVATWNGVFRYGETPVDALAAQATDRASLQCRPNPFGRSVTFEFALPRTEAVLLQITDIRGRTVARLLETVLGAGPHSVAWDARAFGSGIYFLRFQSGTHVETTRVLHLR